MVREAEANGSSKPIRIRALLIWKERDNSSSSSIDWSPGFLQERHRPVFHNRQYSDSLAQWIKQREPRIRALQGLCFRMCRREECLLDSTFLRLTSPRFLIDHGCISSWQSERRALRHDPMFDSPEFVKNHLCSEPCTEQALRRLPAQCNIILPHPREEIVSVLEHLGAPGSNFCNL